MKDGQRVPNGTFAHYVAADVAIASLEAASRKTPPCGRDIDGTDRVSILIGRRTGDARDCDR
jgi:hypothetical protein